MKAIGLKMLAIVLLPTAAMAASAGGGSGASGATGATGAPAATSPGNAGGGTATGPAATGNSNSGGGAAATNGNATAGPNGGAAQGKGPPISESMLPEEPSVRYGREVVVGEPLMGEFTYYPVPNYDEYSYVILDNQRVIVDRGTHRVIEVIP